VSTSTKCAQLFGCMSNTECLLFFPLDLISENAAEGADKAQNGHAFHMFLGRASFDTQARKQHQDPAEAEPEICKSGHKCLVGHGVARLSCAVMLHLTSQSIRKVFITKKDNFKRSEGKDAVVVKVSISGNFLDVNQQRDAVMCTKLTPNTSSSQIVCLYDI